MYGIFSFIGALQLLPHSKIIDGLLKSCFKFSHGVTWPHPHASNMHVHRYGHCVQYIQSLRSDRHTSCWVASSLVESPISVLNVCMLNTHTHIHTHAHTHLCDGAPSVQLLAAELLLASWTTAPPQPLEELFHPPPPLKLLWGCVGWSPATQDLLVCVFVCVTVCVCVCDVQDENMISYIAHTPRWFLSAGSKRSHFHRQNSGCACFSAPRK